MSKNGVQVIVNLSSNVTGDAHAKTNFQINHC